MAEFKTIGDRELENVSGGTGGWQKHAKGSYANYGSHIIYTVAAGDTLAAIAPRFGVTIPQIQQWNCLKNPGALYPGQKLTIYPAAIR